MLAAVIGLGAYVASYASLRAIGCVQLNEHDVIAMTLGPNGCHSMPVCELILADCAPQMLAQAFMPLARMEFIATRTPGVTFIGYGRPL